MSPFRSTGSTTRRVIKVLVVLAIAAAGALGVVRWREVQDKTSIPSILARKADFNTMVRCRGELKARQSVQVIAPKNVPELRIVWLATQGAPVKEGDPLFRFDPSSAKQQLQEKEAALKQAQAALDEAKAVSHVSSEQDVIDLAEAKYQVEKAKLEVSKLEIVSRLQGEESRVDLGMAENKLKVQEATGTLNGASNEAKIASLTRARDKAAADVELNQYRLAQMEVRSPGSGVFHLLPNYSQGWMNAKPFKVGDQVWPGGALAEIPDLSTLEMEGKVEEIDRGRVSVNQAVRVHIDSLPETTFSAKLIQLSPMTVMAWEWPPTRTFRGFAQIETTDTRLRPAMNGSMDVVIGTIKDAVVIPSKAVFAHNGKAIVWRMDQGKYIQAEVEVLARNPDEVAVKGLAESTRIALLEPDVRAVQ